MIPKGSCTSHALVTAGSLEGSFSGGKLLFGMFDIILEYCGRQFHFSLGFTKELTHFQCKKFCIFRMSGAEQVSRFFQDFDKIGY
ncbi:hypothetical protein EDC52_106192 [Biostraticola tofi]|uniref:Uncharacterized protein n=1 Tax=Biostraticola tofi TaxID=466109 RepID=A0A4R3YS15_9GAMM|nr:hypothetical protein EDC52_106192 [Biostraticola tofi]